MSLVSDSDPGLRIEKSSDGSLGFLFRVVGVIQDQLKPFSYTLTYIGFAIRMLQIFGFVLNPFFSFNFALLKELTAAVFIFSGPFFDRSYGPFNALAYFIIVVFTVVLLFVAGIFFTLHCIKPELQEYQGMLRYMRLVTESIAGFLLVPLLHLYMGILPCQSGVLTNFPDTQCGSPLHIAAYFFSILGLLLTLIVALIGCFFFNPDPHSHHILARPHGYVDFLNVLIALVGTIFFHVLLGQGYKASYSIILMVLGGIGLLSHILIIPYYSLRTLCICSGTYLSVTVVALINCLTEFQVSVLTPSTSVLTSTIVFSILPISFAVGYALGYFRVNSDMMHKMHILYFYGYAPEHVALFPFPRTFVSYRRAAPQAILSVYNELKLEAKVEQQNIFKHRTATYENDTLPHQFDFFVPFISNAYFETDSELATRFLRELRLKLGMARKYTSSQLLFTLDMYLKSIAYFKQSPYVFASLGWFLYQYCNRQPAVLELLEHIRSRNNFSSDYMVQFKLFRLNNLVRESLGYRGTTYHLALQRAHIFHRRTLKEMVNVWEGLQTKVDTVTLLGIVEDLTEYRDKAYHEYYLALISSKDDRAALSYLADFIDHVFHQNKIATELRSAIAEMEVEKRNRALFDAQTAQQIGKDHNYIKVGDVLQACEEERRNRAIQHGSERWVFFGFLYYCVFSAVGFLAGMFATFVIAEMYVHHCLARISDIFGVKAAGFAAMYYAEALALYAFETGCDSDAGGCVSDLEFVQRMQNISHWEQEMRMKQNSATFGANKLSISSQGFAYAAKGTLPMRFFKVGSTQYSGLFGTTDASNIMLYSKLSATLLSSSTPTVEWIASPTVSAYITSLVNYAQKSASYSHYLEFVTDGGLDVFLEAMNPFSDAVNTDIHSKQTYTILVGSILLILTVFHIGLLLVARYIISAWSMKNRTVLLQLLRKVPPAAVEDLQISHAAALDAFQKVGQFQDEELHLVADEPGETEWPTPKKRRNTTANAFRATILAVLQSKPGKSCLKQGPANTFGTKRTVRFCLTQYDLVERPRRALKEPPITVTGSKNQIVKDFKKCLQDVEAELEEEQMMEQERRDTYTGHLVTTGYRYQWRKIREKIASWRKTEFHGGFLTAVVFGAIAILLVVACITVLFLSLTVDQQCLNYERSSVTQLQLVYDYVADFDESDITVSAFCNFFYPKYATEFINYAFVNEGYLSLPEALQNIHDPEVLQFVPYSEDLLISVLRPILSNMIYVALAARAGYGLGEFDLPSYAFINNFKWGNQESSVTYLAQTYPSAFDTPNEYTIPALDSSTLPNDPQEFFNTVLPYHRRERFFTDAEAIRASLSSVGESIKETSVHNINQKEARERTFSIVVCAGSAIVMVISAGGAVAVRVRHLGRFPFSFLLMAMICSAACVAISVVLLKLEENSADYIAHSQQDLEDVSLFRTYFYRRLTLIEKYFYSSDATYVKSMFEYQPSRITHYILSILPDYPSMGATVNSIITLDSQYWIIQQVSFYLGYASKAKEEDPLATPSPPSPPFLSTYNYKTEANYAKDNELYGSDHPDLMYSTPAVDLLKDATQLFDMARFAVFGLRGTNYFFDGLSQLDDLMDAISAETLETSKMTHYKIRVLTTLLLVLSFAVLGLLLCAALVPGIRIVRKLAEGLNGDIVWQAFRMASKNSSKAAILFSVFIMIAIILTYAIALVPVMGFDDLSSIAQYSGERVAAIEKSMAKVLFYQHALNTGSASLAFTTLGALKDAITVLTAARNYLYMDDRASTGGFGKFQTFSAAQRALLFTPGQGTGTMDNVYTSWISTLQSMVNFQPKTTVVTPNPDTIMKDDFSIVTSDTDQVNNWVSALEDNYSTLISALQTSDDLFRDQISSTLTKVLIPSSAFFVVGEIILIAAAIFMVRSVVKAERDSEEDIQPLVSAIPKAVIDCVPALSYYADSGMVEEEDDRVEDSYELSEESQAFLAAWREVEEDDSEFEEGSKQLEKNPHPCILASKTGCIMFANIAALNLFKHESLKGKDITILMDQGAAEIHSRMMAYYVANRDKNNYQPRKVNVHAYTKNLDTINVVIVLAEAPLANDQLYFLAEIYPYSAKKVIGKKS